MSATFREETRAWLRENAPASLFGTATSPFQGHWGGRDSAFQSPDHALWFERMLARGWTAPGWPTAYGGGGLPAEEARIVHELLRELGLPMPLVGFGLTMIGPILLACGDEAQKAKHLPSIVDGSIRWCQGYSEPDAGSDLASLRTRGVLEGDTLTLDGQKVWTSHADLADWMFCLVRTDPTAKKRDGISFVLVDMTTPGITVRPIRLISGSSPFCEVFLSSVRVPVENVVGGLNRGWAVARSLLQHERSMVGESVATGGSRPEVLRDYRLAEHAVREVGLDGGRLADPLLRDAIARNEMDRACLELTLQRARERALAGAPPGPESSVFKVVATELNQRHWELAMQVGGQAALGWEDVAGPGEAGPGALGPHGVTDAALPQAWLRSRANTIEGGTTEIQLGIIATTVLGLSR